MTRIIAGAAGSLALKVPPSGTRPTSDRVREAIFSSLEAWNLIDGARVLDLYAGSGALGLEALSRGAAEVVLVEKAASAASVCEANARVVRQAIERAGRPGIARVVRQSVHTYLQQAAGTFDVIFSDPPYELSEAQVAADVALAAALMPAHGVLLVERSSRSPEPAWGERLRLLEERRYGETALWYAELASAPDLAPTTEPAE